MSAMARKMMWSSMALSMALAVTACEKKATPTPPKTDTAPASTSAQTTAETTSAATTPKLSDEQLVKESRKYGHIPIVGDTDRASVTAKFENWKKAEDEAKATEGVGAKLVAVPEGATITIVFGTWCSDCFREIPRLWDALDQVELADRLGFDYAWEVEHHFLDEYSHSSAPEVFLGDEPHRRVLQNTGALNIDVVAAVDQDDEVLLGGEVDGGAAVVVKLDELVQVFAFIPCQNFAEQHTFPQRDRRCWFNHRGWFCC